MIGKYSGQYTFRGSEIFGLEFRVWPGTDHVGSKWVMVAAREAHASTEIFFIESVLSGVPGSLHSPGTWGRGGTESCTVYTVHGT